MTDLRLRLIFSVLIWFSFFGWGRLIYDLLHRRQAKPTAVSHAALGLAGILAIGGILNVFHLLISPVYVLIFAVGLSYAAGAFHLHLKKKSVDWQWVAIVCVVGILVLPSFLQSLDTDYLNGHDDFHAYLVMPLRIGQLGTLQVDEFSYRAAISGPGGMAFLQAPVVELFGINAIRLVDQGSGLMLMIGVAATLLRRVGLSVFLSIALLAGVMLLAGHTLVNVTSYFTTLGLLLALVHVLGEAGDSGVVRLICAALILAGIAALKNTALPFAVMLCGLFLLHTWWTKNPHALRNTLVPTSIVSATLFLWYLPRLLAHVQSPPLIRGDGPDQVNLSYMIWWVTSGEAWNWAYLILFLTTWSVTAYIVRSHSDRLTVMFLGIASIAGNLIMNYATGGVSVTRYTQPLLMISYLVCCAILLTHTRRRILLMVIAPCLVLGFVAFHVFPPPLTSSFVALFPPRAQPPQAGFRTLSGYAGFYVIQPVADYLKSYKAAARHVMNNSVVDFPSKAQVDSIKKIQSVTAPGSAILVHTDMPFLFDFKRNKVSVVDIAMASPSPGMPLEAGADLEFINYLQKQAVRYVIYSYGTEAGFPASMVSQRLTDARFTPWQKAMNRRVPLFHQKLDAISSLTRKIYDDGKIFVVDISEAALPVKTNP